MLSYIKEVEYFGLTGEIVFDGDGFRTHFMLDLMEKFHNRMKKTAIWTEKGGVIFKMVKLGFHSCCWSGPIMWLQLASFTMHMNHKKFTTGHWHFIV